MRLNFAILVTAIIHALWWYPQLPGTIASHFDGSGAADGWMSKDSFFTMYAVIIGFIAVLFLGTVWLVRHIPYSMINIPNREYWLAADRREQTFSMIAGTMQRMGAVTLVFMVFMMHLTFAANLGAPIELGPGVWIGLTLYFAALVCFIVRMYRDFRVEK